MKSASARFKRRPTLPKHTQLQNSTLEIHVATPIVSDVTPETSNVCVSFGAAGEGTMSGLMLSRAAAPDMPTTRESANPALDLSIRYHMNGLTKASVSDTCSVDCHGRRRWISMSASRSSPD